MIRAVLFDIDGVLVDSFEAGLYFVGDILVQMGRPRPSRRLFKKNFNLPLGHTLQKLARAELTEELERLREIVPQIAYRFDLLHTFPHTEDMLTALHEHYSLGIITSRNKEGLKRYFTFSKNKELFDVTITVEDVTHHKPHPEPLLLAATRLKVQPSECIYVGDSHTDVEAGNAAGMRTILYGGKRNQDADAHTKSFRKLPAIIASF